MNGTVVHHPRLAWDGARAFVAAVSTFRYPELSARMGALLGRDYQLRLAQTRKSIATATRPDIELVESGMWRVRLEELLNARPELAASISALIAEARGR